MNEANSIPWPLVFERTGRDLRGSEIRDLLAIGARPDVISFAGGLPAPELFPVQELRRSFDAVLADEGARALQYGPTQGHPPLREYLADRMRGLGVACSPEEILVTTGSQQGLDLIGKTLMAPGMRVIIESPTFVGALQAFGNHQVDFQAFSMDDSGLDVEAVGDWLEGIRAGENDGPPPALIYTIPTFQNPFGATLALDRRHRLLELSLGHGIPIVEDDPYSAIRFDSAPVPPLKALARGRDVIYLGTFSKILAPGLRLGWVVAPRPLIAKLVLAKQGTDLHTDSLTQRAVLRYCLTNDLEAHIARLREEYRVRRDVMLECLRERMPAEASWRRPDGGFFIWVTLPEGMDATLILPLALAQKVAYVPGAGFHSGRRTLRLNFSNCDPGRIREGIARLGTVITDAGPGVVGVGHTSREGPSTMASARQWLHD